jgi:bifunctional DNase/RNase
MRSSGEQRLKCFPAWLMNLSVTASEGTSVMPIEMQLIRIVITETTDQQTIFLKERHGSRVLPMFIGQSEALAIDYRVREARSPRPLTHQLLGNVISELGGELQHVVIHELKDGVFYAKLVVLQHEQRIEIDSRPSDAVALALSAGVKIFVEERVLDEVCNTGG